MTISLIFIGLVTIVVLNPQYEKTLVHRGHTIKYRQYLMGKTFSNWRHRPTNEELADQAYIRLANRLLDDYLLNRDSQLIDEVIKISIDHNLRYRIKNISADSLIENRERVLDTTMWVIDP